MTKPESIRIRTDVLNAVAKWAHHDPNRGVGAVAFRDNTITATDGHRLVVVPHDTRGLAFGVVRNHLLAAVAAQNALARASMEPPLPHDLEDIEDGDLTLTDGPFGDRAITLSVSEFTVLIDIGGARDAIPNDIGRLIIRSPRIDLALFPTQDPLNAVLNAGGSSGSPDGYLLDPRFLAAVSEVNTATANYQSGVRVTRWSSVDDLGVRSPLVMENVKGVRFAIMPQMDPPELNRS